MGATAVRHPVVAGTFYHLDRENLEEQLEGFFSSIETKPDCIGAVSPHAGYMYSGKTAAVAVSSLKKADKFIILGPNHTGLGAEFSIMPEGVWRTPLGECVIDREMASDIKKCGVVGEDSLAHLQEHSIEVQLPFLQHRFGDVRFVPVSIMNVDYSGSFLKKCVTLGERIAELNKKDGNIGVVASSDFSHYLPLDIAAEKDKRAIEMIKKLDVKGFFQALEEINASVCGYGPIAVLMVVAKKLGLRVKVIDSSSSGDATGDFGSVVTYYAIGFC
jgi:hypothetical protein